MYSTGKILMAQPEKQFIRTCDQDAARLKAARIVRCRCCAIAGSANGE